VNVDRHVVNHGAYHKAVASRANGLSLVKDHRTLWAVTAWAVGTAAT
jgi:hypothetical protein